MCRERPATAPSAVPRRMCADIHRKAIDEGRDRAFNLMSRNLIGPNDVSGQTSADNP